MSYDRGDVTQLNIETRNLLHVLADPDVLKLLIVKPSGEAIERVWPGVGELEQVSEGIFKSTVELDEAGIWYYRWEATGAVQLSENGFLSVQGDQFEGPVSDLSDTRTLIPRVRRALDGPEADSPVALSTTLSDTQVNAVIADAIAEVIFFTPDGFGKTLEVVARDPHYLAPIAWRTSEALTDAEASVIVFQAALNHLYAGITAMKTSEKTVNEGESWEWTISSNAVAERVKALQKLRDDALDALASTATNVTDWVNTLEVRDAYTDALIEPWIGGGMMAGGQEFVQ